MTRMQRDLVRVLCKAACPRTLAILCDDLVGAEANSHLSDREALIADEVLGVILSSDAAQDPVFKATVESI